MSAGDAAPVPAAGERAVLRLASSRDEEVATWLLAEAGLPCAPAADIAGVAALLHEGAGLLVAAEECLRHADLGPLSEWLARQPPWSDLPVLVLTQRGGGPERNPALARLTALLGNATFVERPFHPATLANAARAALRARRRQYEARTRLDALAAAEAALRGANDALERRVAERTAELVAAQESLAHAQRMEALGQLAGGIAHDFNNVLQVVQGGVALIERRGGDAAGVARIARMVAEAAERGAAVTRRLLAFARRGELRAEPLDAGALLAELREILAHTLGVEVEVRVVLDEAGQALPAVMADKGQLETVLVNLASNARDAMEGLGGGALTLSAARDVVWPGGPADPGAALAAGEYLRLSVADTGVGMPPEVLQRAAEPFFTTKPTGRGTGLGLAMAKGFAEQSGGAMRIESTPGHGTVVTLWLPAGGTAASAEAPRPPARTAAAGEGRRASVLLVDDDALVRRVTAEGLSAAGFRVLMAAGVAPALDRLAGGEAVDAVVTDLSMPGIGGLALIREVRRRWPGLPVVLLTGQAGDAAELAAAGEAGFALLRKPVAAAALAERVSALLAARG